MRAKEIHLKDDGRRKITETHLAGLLPQREEKGCYRRNPKHHEAYLWIMDDRTDGATWDGSTESGADTTARPIYQSQTEE